MKLCFPYDPHANGGHMVSSFLLIEGWRARGRDIAVAVHGAGAVREEAQRRGFPVVDLPPLVAEADDDDPRADRARLSALAAAPAALGYLKRAGIDAVHVNDRRMLRFWAPVAALARRPLIAHWRSTYSPSRSIDVALRLTRRLIAVSDYSRDTLPAFAARKTDVVFNPFEVTLEEAGALAARRSVRARYAIPDDALVVGQFGSLLARKRPEFLIALLEALAAQGRPVWGLLVGGPAGPTPERYAAALAAGGPALTRLVCTGHVPDAVAHMAACDAIVQPAYKEPLARVGVEAQSVGAALIVADDGGLKEVVRDGEDGFVLPADDFAAWVALVGALIDQPDRRRAIGVAARAAAARLTLARHMAGVEAVYARAGLPLTA